MSEEFVFDGDQELVIEALNKLIGHAESRSSLPPEISKFFLELTIHLNIGGSSVARMSSLLFSNFIWEHVYSVVLEIRRSSDVSYNGTRNNLKNQIFLRVVTCISIASKYDNQFPPFSQVSKQILSLLEFLSNPSFTIRSLKKSEIRVLETVKWNIEKRSAVDSIHMLILLLKPESIGFETKRTIVSVIHLILDLLDMAWNSIFSGEFMNVIYLSAVIVSASTYISCGQFKSQKVTEELTKITHFGSRDIFENRDSLLLILSSPLDP